MRYTTFLSGYAKSCPKFFYAFKTGIPLLLLFLLCFSMTNTMAQTLPIGTLDGGETETEETDSPTNNTPIIRFESMEEAVACEFDVLFRIHVVV